MKKRTAAWRCKDPKHHPKDCFCKLVVLQVAGDKKKRTVL